MHSFSRSPQWIVMMKISTISLWFVKFSHFQTLKFLTHAFILEEPTVDCDDEDFNHCIVMGQTFKLSNINISTSCIHSRGAQSWSQWWRFQQYDWTSWQRSISRAHLTHIQCILYIYNIQCISYTVKIRLGTEVIDKRFHTFAPKMKKTQEPFVNGWQRRRGDIHLFAAKSLRSPLWEDD